MYGGCPPSYDDSYNDLYVLSLPSFHWLRADEQTNTGRARGTRIVIGQRHMLTIGGVDTKRNYPEFFWDRDPFPRGLGIFDMTAMTWIRNGRYNASAEAYRSPQAVEEWYKAR